MKFRKYNLFFLKFPKFTNPKDCCNASSASKALAHKEFLPNGFFVQHDRLKQVSGCGKNGILKIIFNLISLPFVLFQYIFILPDNFHKSNFNIFFLHVFGTHLVETNSIIHLFKGLYASPIKCSEKNSYPHKTVEKNFAPP